MKGRRRETRRGKRSVIVYVLYCSRRQREIKKTAMRHKRGELYRSDRKSERETMVCTQDTAMRHKRGRGNRSDRNFRARNLYTHRNIKRCRRKCLHLPVLMNSLERNHERWWVLLKIPRCDIDGVGEGK